MKISVVIFGVIIMIISVTAIVTLTNGYSETNNDKLRVDFFPSIGHAVPIVGLENEIFQERIGEQIKIDTVNDYKGYEKFMDSLGSLGIY